MQYYIWGTGDLAERLMQHLPIEKIKGFIDGNEEKIGRTFRGRKILSFEEYLGLEKPYYIIVAVKNFFSIRDRLKKSQIKSFFLMVDFPGVWLDRVYHPWLEEYVVEDIKQHKKIAIYGCNPYSLCVREWIRSTGGDEPVFIRSRFEDIDYGLLEEEGIYCRDWTETKETFDRIYITTRSLEEMISHENHVLDIWNYADKVKKYHHEKIKQLRNKYRGKRCFIVGNGPSLRMEDLAILENNHECSFGVNEVFKAFERTMWRPTFYVADYVELERIGFGQEVLRAEAVYLLLSNVNGIEKKEDSNIYQFHINYSNYPESLPPFSEDSSQFCQGGGTITYLCMQLAVYMGFEEIFLIGVDFTHGKTGSGSYYNHFYEETPGGESYCYETAVENAYLSAKQYADAHGIKIFNATRGGMLEIFPRVDFDTLF